jgi:hypothetical protein
VCSAEWGISPAEFERQAEAVEFTFADVHALIRYLSFDPIKGPAVRQSIWQERIEEMRQLEEENAAMDLLWEMAKSQAGTQKVEADIG